MPDTTTFEERYEVEPNYDGWRLDQYLTEKLRRASRSQVTRIIKASVRFEDGRRVKPGAIVRGGDVVVIERPERSDPASPAPEALTLIADLGDVIVMNKPPGLLVHRTAREASRTVDAYLRARFPDRRVEAVHRLDRDTSGVLVCAAGEAAIRELRARFRDGGVEKRYDAMVLDVGAFWSPGDAHTFDTPLGLDPSSTLGVRMGRGDLPCRTHARCVARDGAIATLDVRIEQGRQHQIRAHLWLAGTPIVGDKLYQMGDDFFRDWADAPGEPSLVARLDARWHRLHAAEAGFAWDGEARRFLAPAPWTSPG